MLTRKKVRVIINKLPKPPFVQHQLLRLSFLQDQFLRPPLFWVVPVPKTPLFWVVPVPNTPFFGCAAAHPHQHILRVPPGYDVAVYISQEVSHWKDKVSQNTAFPP